jgi:sortase B
VKGKNEMPQYDSKKYKYTLGHKQRKRKHQNPAVAVASGIFPWSGDTASDIARKCVFLVSVFALTFSAIMILNFYFGAHDEQRESGYWVVDIDDDSTGMWANAGGAEIGNSAINPNDASDRQVEILERYRHFLDINPEFIGYLSIDPYINYPVAQAQGDKPNDWYLNHNFEGVPTTNGTIFACKFGEFSPPTALSSGRPDNIILHGHNLLITAMFQPLTRYRDDFTFLQDNPIIRFDTLYEPGLYKIFSVFQINTDAWYGEYYDYARKRNFGSSDDFYEYVSEALDRSRYHTDVDLRYGDELLTLSTCDHSMLSGIRLVVVARRVRDNEAPFVNTEAFTNLRAVNPSNPGRDNEGFMLYKMFDGFYRSVNNHRGWAGRQWDTSRVEGIDEFFYATERW